MGTNVEATDGSTRQLRLHDGRVLAYAEYGDPAGTPLLFFHGTPGSRLQLRDADEAARRTNVRLLCPDRPGYGESSPQPDRTVGGYAEDMRELADRLGLDRFAVAGVSGGGGYAAACAARLPDRVTIAIVIAGMAPASKAALREMSGRNRAVLRLARWAPWALGLMLKRLGATIATGRPDAFERLAKDLPAADAALIRRPEVRATFVADTVESLRQGSAAAVTDLRLYTQPYDFALEDIAVPVHLFHGDADVNVPIAIGRDVAARIPSCHATFVPGGGHMWFLDHLDEIMALAATAADQP